ncbi:MAG: hypothetical protein WBB82_09405 [Limnothrix sp.]
MQLPLTEINRLFHAQAIAVDSQPDLFQQVADWQLGSPKPTLVIVGGAGGIAEADQATLQKLFIDCVAPWAQANGLAVVDGGTDAGIMRFIGIARDTIQGTFPLIGVVAEGTVNLPERPASNPYAAELEPHHSHFVLVPGGEWGDESPWLAQTATAIAQQSPSITFVINGGKITWQDLQCSINEKRPIVTFAGSGRTADILAEALHGNIQDEQARNILQQGQIQSLSLKASATELQSLLQTLFKRRLSPMLVTTVWE